MKKAPKNAVRAVVLVLAATALSLTFAAPALAGPVIDRTVNALQNDPVYVDPSVTDLLKEDQAAQVRNQIKGGSAPIVVAVLPADIVTEAGGADQVPTAIGKALKDKGKDTTVAVLFKNTNGGTSFRAGSNVLGQGQAASLADAAFNGNKDKGPAVVLGDFVGKVQAVKSGAGSQSGSNSGGGARTTAPAAEPAKSGGISAALVGLLCFGGFILIVIIAIFAIRKMVRSASSGPGPNYLPPGPLNQGGGGYQQGGYQGGGYQPGYGGRSGPGFGTGLAAGAVAGGLGGYALHEMLDNDDDNNNNDHGDQNDNAGGGDWGGGGGDWNSEPSGGGDWGGGGDSGGGGDFGGGGDW